MRGAGCCPWDLRTRLEPTTRSMSSFRNANYSPKLASSVSELSATMPGRFAMVPSLEPDDLTGALRYAAEAVRERQLHLRPVG